MQTRVRASNDEGIASLSTEKQVEDLAENTEVSGALVLLSDRERIELREINAALARIENRPCASVKHAEPESIGSGWWRTGSESLQLLNGGGVLIIEQCASCPSQRKRRAAEQLVA